MIECSGTVLTTLLLVFATLYFHKRLVQQIFKNYKQFNDINHSLFLTVIDFPILSLFADVFALVIGLSGSLWPSQTAGALAQTNALTSGVENAEDV